MTRSIHYKTPICYRCDRDKHPGGKSVLNDKYAIQNEKGEWICSECQTQETTRLLSLFGGQKK
jgi:hypothetical protein